MLPTMRLDLVLLIKQMQQVLYLFLTCYSCKTIKLRAWLNIYIQNLQLETKNSMCWSIVTIVFCLLFFFISVDIYLFSMAE